MYWKPTIFNVTATSASHGVVVVTTVEGECLPPNLHVGITSKPGE